VRGGLLSGLLRDLEDEGQELDALVAGLSPAGWATATPSAGWTIAHQIAHLAWTDEVALRAATHPGAFRADRDASGQDVTRDVDRAAADGAAVPPTELLARWRTARSSLGAALAAVPDGTALPWFGPDMSAASMATARLMETWAHGVDIRDALRRATPATRRLRAVAHLGVRTRDFAFRQRALTPPAREFRVELSGPDGDVWAWGPVDAPQGVTGPALDFCLRVTQRRHRDDLGLRAYGPDADRWLDIAQAFAGPPGSGRAASTP
jgi:uncharacterized protein (TIGR03084 family)